MEAAGIVLMGFFVLGIFIERLGKSLERDHSKVHNLLAEIRDKLGKP